MSAIYRTPFFTMLMAALGLSACAAATPPVLDADAAARLAHVRLAPEDAGARIYRGTVFAPEASPGASPLFRYERRVRATAAGAIRASHITRDPHGVVLIEEAAEVSSNYTLRRFDMANRQTGASGSAVVSTDDRSVVFTLRQGGKEKTDSEAITDPLVTGPSLHGFVLRQWDTLAAGATVQVQMLVLADMRSYGFEIRRASVTADGHTTFSITPSSWFVRLAVAPLVVTFATNSRHVVRYAGRVPPMRLVDGRLRAFDARVEYSDHAAAYR